jgi:hypothetical protein
MPSRRTVKKRKPPQGPDLARRAKAEVARLLKRTKAGTITRVQLQTGLKDVEELLENLHFYWL